MVEEGEGFSKNETCHTFAMGEYETAGRVMLISTCPPLNQICEEVEKSQVCNIA
jgi:hypothetical protein